MEAVALALRGLARVLQLVATRRLGLPHGSPHLTISAQNFTLKLQRFP